MLFKKFARVKTEDFICAADKAGFFMHYSPGTMTTYAESINSDLQRGLDRRLRHTQH